MAPKSKVGFLEKAGYEPSSHPVEQMKKMPKWLRYSLAALLLALIAVYAVYAVDRLVLAPACPPCHADLTRALPLLNDMTTQGLVRIQVVGRQFRARVAGLDNRDGDGVILLHGYPDTSIMWEPALERLAEHGYRVVAFDQRGYSPGARPGSVSAYTADQLAGDVIAVANALGFARFHLVGHDWGGVIGWITADLFPDRVATWTSLSTPHPAAFSDALSLSEGGDQLKRSSYVLLNWMPGLAELVLGFNQAAYLQRFVWGSRTPAQRKEYIQVFTEPGALRAVLNWYRVPSFVSRTALAKTRQPTLFIWGNQDRSLGRRGAEKTASHVSGPFRFVGLHAGHSLMVEAPEKISTEILSHLQNWRIADLPVLTRAPTTATRERDAKCALSKPHCLRIQVSPEGRWLKVQNKCEEQYRVAIKLRCSEWMNKASVNYTFQLGPGGMMLQESRGLGFGICYYNQKVCVTK